MKYLFPLLLLLAVPSAMFAQSDATIATTRKLKVVFQLTSSDSLVQKALVRQLNNFLTAAPNAKLEVVCHSNGISFLQTASNKHAGKIKELRAKGVDFVACENTMRERKIKREELVEDCRTVPSGVVEVALKQDKSWSYIKAGF
jgi:hypothetical protein